MRYEDLSEPTYELRNSLMHEHYTILIPEDMLHAVKDAKISFRRLTIYDDRYNFIEVQTTERNPNGQLRLYLVDIIIIVDRLL